MDSRLTYSPEHYKERLSAYAKDTVECRSEIGTKYKINKNDNPAVVEDLGSQFKIYVHGISDIPFARPPVDRNILGDFFALVTINDDIKIEVFRRNYAGVFFPIWIAFIVYFSFKNIKDGDFGFFASLALFLLFTCFLRVYWKKRYKRFIVDFMNTIAA